MPFHLRQCYFVQSCWHKCVAGFLVFVFSVSAAGAAFSHASEGIVSQAARAMSASARQPEELDRARKLLEAVRWEEAAALIRTYLQKHPSSLDAHSLLGLILYRGRQPRASMAEYVQASQLGDLTAFDLRIFAMDCAAIPDFPEAEKWMLRSLAIDDRDAATWEALGHVRFAAQHYEQAIEALEHALQLAPRTVSAKSLIGLADERMARLDVAEAAYRTAIEWQEGRAEIDAVPLLGLGRVLMTNNQPEEAIGWLQRAAKAASAPAEVHEVLGLAYSKTAHPAMAAEELETAIRLQPQSARLHLMLARAYRSLGKAERSDAELKLYSTLNGNGVQ
jgi:Tfp pilus assembly protein PilF